MSVLNTLPAGIYVIDRLFPGGQGRPPVDILQLAGAVVTLASATALVLTQVGLDFSDSAYFWLVVSVTCCLAYTLHCRIADARYTSWDRLYYNSIFRSVIVLVLQHQVKVFSYPTSDEVLVILTVMSPA